MKAGTDAALRVVRPEEFTGSTAQTPGSQRAAAICPELGIQSGLWAGTFRVEPGARTGIHHHGDQETVVYVLEGEAEVRWGAKGEHTARVRAGDFLHVPGWVIHQEINRSADVAFRWVVVRSSPEPIVVNLPESEWDDAAAG
jgi:uncharacterized RmlC-like cupin family protein